VEISATSADAAGFPIAPLLFNADELATGQHQPRPIRSFFPIRECARRFFVFPATHAGGPSGPASAPPYGVALPFEILVRYVAAIASGTSGRARHAEYGMFLADGAAGSPLNSAERTRTRWPNTLISIWSHDLQAIKVTDFEVLAMGKPIPLNDECCAE